MGAHLIGHWLEGRREVVGLQLEVRSRLLRLPTSDSEPDLGCPSPLVLLNYYFWVFLLQNLIPFLSIMFSAH